MPDGVGRSPDSSAQDRAPRRAHRRVTRTDSTSALHPVEPIGGIRPLSAQHLPRAMADTADEVADTADEVANAGELLDRMRGTPSNEARH